MEAPRGVGRLETVNLNVPFFPLTSALDQASCHPAPFTLSTLLSTGAGSLAQHRRHLPTQCPRLSPEPLPVIFPSYPDASLSSLPLLWPLILPDAIFPSSPLGCEHPGIRKNVIPVFHVVLGLWQAFRGWGGPGKTLVFQKFCFSTSHRREHLSKYHIQTGWTRGSLQSRSPCVSGAFLYQLL